MTTVARSFIHLGFGARAGSDLFVYDAVAPLVVVDGLDIVGAASFVLDEAAVIRLADHLNRALPLP